jgi:ring-1,2-phenylacetyl-CoA epoxidase subunit PaaE
LNIKSIFAANFQSMSNFHPLPIKEVKRETEDTVSIAIDMPDHLKNAFAYTQGQYLTFKKRIQDEELRRSYSLCSSPVTDSEWRVAIKKVDGGKFSSFANENLKSGDVLEVMMPEGNFFTEVKEGQSKTYTAFAAGSGITPIMSIMKTVLAVESGSKFNLYYGNKSENSIIFKEEIDALQSQYGDRLNVWYVLSREDKDGYFGGRIDPAKCDEFELNDSAFYQADDYFLCGPEEMIFSVKDKLVEKGVSSDKVHFELFTTPVKADEGSEEEVPDLDAEVTVIMDGEEFNYTLNSKGDSILDSAMDAGADVPFSCKGAVCCTCRAKVTEGKVHMDMNYALTDEEVEEGYVLTCQSHPVTSKVTVDYDED